jgi:hypothetical protein
MENHWIAKSRGRGGPRSDQAKGRAEAPGEASWDPDSRAWDRAHQADLVPI